MSRLTVGLDDPLFSPTLFRAESPASEPTVFVTRDASFARKTRVFEIECLLIYTDYLLNRKREGHTLFYTLHQYLKINFPEIYAIKEKKEKYSTSKICFFEKKIFVRFAGYSRVLKTKLRHVGCFDVRTSTVLLILYRILQKTIDVKLHLIEETWNMDYFFFWQNVCVLNMCVCIQ